MEELKRNVMSGWNDMTSTNEFKENLLFEEYKDKYVRSAKGLVNDIIKERGYEPSGNLYRRIVNYQIEKYGRVLRYSGKIRNRVGLSRKARKRNSDWVLSKYHQDTLIERAEENARRKNKNKNREE